MKLTKQLVEERKTLFFLGEQTCQKAEITIEFVNDEGLKNTGYWRFIGCNFKPERVPYSLSDWEFLSAINDKIKELIK